MTYYGGQTPNRRWSWLAMKCDIFHLTSPFGVPIPSRKAKNIPTTIRSTRIIKHEGALHDIHGLAFSRPLTLAGCLHLRHLHWRLHRLHALHHHWRLRCLHGLFPVPCHSLSPHGCLMQRIKECPWSCFEPKLLPCSAPRLPTTY